MRVSLIGCAAVVLVELMSYSGLHDGLRIGCPSCSEGVCTVSEWIVGLDR
jgi:hypothetical protein